MKEIKTQADKLPLDTEILIGNHYYKAIEITEIGVLITACFTYLAPHFHRNDTRDFCMQKILPEIAQDISEDEITWILEDTKAGDKSYLSTSYPVYLVKIFPPTLEQARKIKENERVDYGMWCTSTPDSYNYPHCRVWVACSTEEGRIPGFTLVSQRRPVLIRPCFWVKRNTLLTLEVED